MTGMSMIVKTVTRWQKGFILLFGIYFTVYGHLEHSGGFAGGVIIACAFILVYIAESKSVENHLLSKNAAAELASISSLLFLGIGTAGLFMSGTFFKNFISTPESAYFKLWSSGIILILNLCIGLMVSTTLFVLFATLSAIKVTIPKDQAGADIYRE